MFKKKPNIKPLSPLKSSDRRRTADQIIHDFAIPIPVDPAADPDDKAASTAGLTALRKKLLPENALSARFTTTAGPDLKKVDGTIYAGSHEGTGDIQRILWVKVEEKMYPTVYTLWHNPQIVPLLYTPAFVVEKLQGGADLMTPGLQRGPPFPKKATKGAIVAIASLEKPTVPMAVGTCEIDVSALDKVQGMKGHAVSTFHWAGDELWSWSSGGKPGMNAPEHLEGWDVEKTEDGVLAEQAAAIDLSDEDGGVSLEADPTERSEAEKAQGLEGEDAPSLNDAFEVVDEPELSQKEIDKAFHDAFLYGVRHHMEQNRNQPNYGLDFPLSQSNVMSLLVQPFLPTYTPARTASLQIKKTSWKNIRKFIKSLDKAKIIKSKDRDSHEVVILDIDFKDAQIEAFKPYRLPKKDAPTGASVNGKPAASLSAESSVGQTLKVVSLLRPKEKVAPIFVAAKADPRGLYTPSELKQILSTYIETESLVSTKNRRLININPQIANSLLGTSSATDASALSSGTITRDALAERLVAATSPFHCILRNSASVADSKPKAGAPPKIQIVLETRSGNKTVTKVSGVEVYYISPQPLADELRKVCAGSTSVDMLVGSSPKNPVMEVMIQGPQKDAVIKALEKRGVNRNWVEVVDKTKGKKKG